MATTNTQALIDELARRLRDTSNTGHARTVVLDILDRCHKSLNAGLGLKLATASLLPTAEQVMYLPTAVASDVIRVVAVRDGGRNLAEVPWDTLVHNDPNWFRRVGPRPELFSRIGRDILVLYPATKSPVTLSVGYVKLPATLVDSVLNFAELPEEHMGIVLDMAEAVLLLRGRIFEPQALHDVLGRLKNSLGPELFAGRKDG